MVDLKWFYEYRAYLFLCHNFHLKTYEIKDKVHAKMFKEPGRSVYNLPAGSVDVEMRFCNQPIIISVGI
jgi:hypothetical protein